MLALQLSKETEQRLEETAARMGRTKEDCAETAIVEFLEGTEDERLAVERLERQQPGIPLEEVERRLGLAD
jgi:RHH-type transcriptional regulator, rel operon repressor / antitoxin RelB